MTSASRAAAKKALRFRVPLLYTLLLTLFSGIAISEIRAFYNHRDFRRAVIDDARVWQKVDRSVVELFQIGSTIDLIDTVTVDSEQELAQANVVLASEIRKLDELQRSLRGAIVAMRPEFHLPEAPTMAALESLKRVADQLGISVHHNLVAMQNGDLTLRTLNIYGNNNLVIGYNDSALRVSSELEKFRIASIQQRADESAKDATSTLWLGWIGIAIIPMAAILGFMIMRRD